LSILTKTYVQNYFTSPFPLPWFIIYFIKCFSYLIFLQNFVDGPLQDHCPQEGYVQAIAGSEKYEMDAREAMGGPL
jgi:hypothetical protein